MRTTYITGRLRASVLLLASLLLPASAPLRADSSPAEPSRDPESDALSRLERAGTGLVRARFEPSTGRLSGLRGRFAAPEGEPEGVAREFLARHADLFRMRPGLEDLVLTGLTEDPGGATVRLEQRHQGVPVFDGQVLVGLDAGGVIVHVRSRYVSGLALATEPKISEIDAWQAAEDSLGSPFEVMRDSPRLVVVRGGKGRPGYYLAWEVHGFSADPLGDWHVFVDALSGEVVRSLNLLKLTGPVCVPCDPVADAPGCGSLFFHDPVVVFDDPSLRDADNVDGAQVSCALDDLTSPSQLDGLYASTQITAGRVTPPYDYLRSVNQQAFDELICYFHADRAKRYLTGLGFPGVMDFPIKIDAHDPSVGDNSYYDPGTKEMHFGEGGVDDGQDPEIVLHEYGHAIQDNQVPGFGYTSEGGAMGEGFGDYWAAALLDDQSASLLGAECIGAWDATAWNPYTGAFGTGCLRRLDNAWYYPQDLRYEVHDDGEIWSASLWNLRGAVGGPVADRLVIKSHTFLAPGADFLDGADALLSADDTLYGGAYAGAVRDALRARGIPHTGTSAPSAGMTLSAPFVCESTHRYAAYEYVECVHTQPGASRIRFHFSRLETEADYDWVYISDDDYGQVQQLSGDPFSSGGGYSTAVRGETIVARFKADYVKQDWGFSIDSVEYVQGAGWIPDGSATPGSPLTAHHGPGGEVTLVWEPSCASGDDDYEVYEGSLGDFASHAPRLCSTGGATTATITPAGGDVYYLVVPRNAAGEGSYGRRSDGAERPQSTTACLPQEIAGSCP